MGGYDIPLHNFTTKQRVSSDSWMDCGPSKKEINAIAHALGWTEQDSINVGCSCCEHWMLKFDPVKNTYEDSDLSVDQLKACVKENNESFYFDKQNAEFGKYIKGDDQFWERYPWVQISEVDHFPIWSDNDEFYECEICKKLSLEEESLSQ